MLLVVATIDGTDYKISTDTCALASLYKPYVTGFDAPRVAIATPHGGFASVVYGGITIRPDFFTGTLWPPPQKIDLSISWTETTEAAAVSVFYGFGQKSRVTATGVEYDLFPVRVDRPLLTQTIEYTSLETVPVPVVFGSYDGIDSVKIRTDSNPYLWSMCGMSESGLAVYNGASDITSSCTFNGDGTFSTNLGYTGLKLYGSGVNTTLAGVAEYCADIMGLSYDGANARSPSPTVAHVVENQTKTLDFLSDICATYTHFFYIKNSALYLCDMGAAINTTTLTEYDFFSAQYEHSGVVGQYSTTILGNDYTLIVDDVNGSTVTVEPYNTDIDAIVAAMRAVTTYYGSDRIVVQIPITPDLPGLGDNVTITDSRLPTALTSTFFVRAISYDLVAGTATIEGEGWLGSEPTFTVPAGLIIGYDTPSTGVIPGNWLIYPHAHERFLVGAGDTYDVGDIGGANKVSFTSGSTGGHFGISGNGYWAKGYAPGDNNGLCASTYTSEGAHSHTITGSYTPAYQNIVLIQAQSQAEKIPGNAVLFSKSNSAPTGFSVWGNTGDRFFRAHTGDNTAAESKGALTCGYAGAHVHGSQSTGYYSGGLFSRRDYHIYYHQHTVSADYTTNLKRAYVAAYKAAADIGVPTGLIGMWDDLDNIPSGWALCDGTEGTPNLVNYFICNSTDATQANVGDNTASNPTITTGSHSHVGDNFPDAQDYITAGYHVAAVAHTHLTAVADILPKYYAIGFIQYMG